MSPAPVRARCLLVASAMSIIVYASSLTDPSWVLAALVLGALGVVVTSPRVGVRVPRIVAGLATLAVLLTTIAGVAETRDLDIHDFGAFVVWMMVIKAFDRRNAGDDAQLLAFAVFLSVASMLLSNGLIVAMLTLAFLPFAAYSAMHLQLRLSHDRASRLARHRVEQADRVPGVRPASSAATGGSLTRTSLVALLVGFMFAALVFVVVPRGAGLRQLGMWGNPAAGRVVSFSSRVNVGTGGAISTSRTPVLHMSLETSEGQPYGGAGAVQYLRGAVLDNYKDGVWTTSRFPVAEGSHRRLDAEVTDSFLGAGGGTMIYQDITLLNTPPEYTYLFALWQPMAITPEQPTEIKRTRDHRAIMALTGGGKFRYTVKSAPFDSPYRPRGNEREPVSWPSPVVHEVAARVLTDAGIEPDPAKRPIADDGLAISAFRQFFWDNYTYSLGEPPPPRRVDPIDWFLTEADRGHCEHYASALAAMCRSVGIRARVITGYLAVEYNRSTAHYVVRESNAHAWVEAQYEPGLWKTYDATPPTDIMAVHGPKPGLAAGFGRFLDSLNYRWINSIVSFDAVTRSNLLSWSEPATDEIGEKADTVLKHLRVAPPGEIALLAVRLFLIFTAVVFGVYGLGLLSRRWLRARARRPKAMVRQIHDPAVRGRLRATPLYQDTLTTLARAGYRKPEWQPIGDWAKALAAHSAELAAVVTELCELFYVMRFGGRDLHAPERARAQELLARLPAAIDAVGR